METLKNLSTNVDLRLLETEFSIDICQPRHSSIVQSIFDCRLFGVIEEHFLYFMVLEIV